MFNFYGAIWALVVMPLKHVFVGDSNKVFFNENDSLGIARKVDEVPIRDNMYIFELTGECCCLRLTRDVRTGDPTGRRPLSTISWQNGILSHRQGMSVDVRSVDVRFQTTAVACPCLNAELAMPFSVWAIQVLLANHEDKVVKSW